MHIRDSVPYMQAGGIPGSQEHELERLVMSGRAGPAGIHQPLGSSNMFVYGQPQGLSQEQQLLMGARK